MLISQIVMSQNESTTAHKVLANPTWNAATLTTLITYCTITQPHAACGQTKMYDLFYLYCCCGQLINLKLMYSFTYIFCRVFNKNLAVFPSLRGGIFGTEVAADTGAQEREQAVTYMYFSRTFSKEFGLNMLFSKIDVLLKKGWVDLKRI